MGRAVPSENGAFTLTVDLDLCGFYLTAYGQRALHLGWSGDYHWTSEFSDTLVQVPPPPGRRRAVR